MSSWTLTKYKTRNWAEYNLSLKNRGSLSIWFDAEMTWEAVPSGRRGRQQTYSDAAIQACLTFKVLFGLPLRQTTGFVASLLKLVGLDWTAPDFSTLCRRQKTLSVAIPYKGSIGPLQLLAPSCLMILAVSMRIWNSCAARHLCQAAAEVGPFPSWSLRTVAE